MQTPHSGCQWNGRRTPFFEGWYYRITLPPGQFPARESLAFMVSLQAPGAHRLDDALQPGGGMVQVLGPDEAYACRDLPDLKRFWACRERLVHGQSLVGGPFGTEGYKATAHRHAGHICDPSSGRRVRWNYSVQARYGWGVPGRAQRSTAGWMSRWQLFEPGWQVLMAHGWATGWFEMAEGGDGDQGLRRIHFENAPAYAEKNWGGAFPSKWFWIQCNAFADQPDLTVTAAGGLRRVLGWQESVGMVGVHHQGQFFEFVPWNAAVTWQVSPWGRWHIRADRGDLAIELTGTTAETGVQVQVPTAEGMEFLCRDTTRGQLSLRLWDTRGPSPRLLLRSRSDQAGLEVGGRNWREDWRQPG